MKDKKIVITVDKEIKLIDILKEKLSDASIKTLKQYFKYDKVYLNSILIHNSNLVPKVGDTLEVIFKKGNNIELDILYEDDNIVVINKPFGLLSIGNSKEKEVTAYRYVSDYVKSKDKNNKIFVVHRLDEETSGVLIFAKSETVANMYQERWNDLVSLREYYAIVPCIVKNNGTIKSHLLMNHNQIVYSSKNGEGKLAITNYEVIKCNNKYSLLRVCIDTGRRNQIRVHMSENFKPIVGDKKYGSKDNSINRLALHASCLFLKDPITSKTFEFIADIPEEFNKLV